MTKPNLRDRSLDEWLSAVQPLSGLGVSDDQLRAALAVIAKSALEVSDGLSSTASEVRRLTDSTAAFNEQAGKLTQEIVRLNRSLTWATWVIAGGTILVAIAAFVSAGGR